MSQAAWVGFHPTAQPAAESLAERPWRKAYFSKPTFPGHVQLTTRLNGCRRCHQPVTFDPASGVATLRHGVSPPLSRPQSLAIGSRKCSQAIVARQRKRWDKLEEAFSNALSSALTAQ